MAQLERPSWGVIIGMATCAVLGLSIPLLLGWVGDEVDEAHPDTEEYCVVSESRAEGDPGVEAGTLLPAEEGCRSEELEVCGYFQEATGLEADAAALFVSQDCAGVVPD